MVRHVFAQSTIDVGLVPFIPCRPAAKPLDQICIESQGDLLLDRAKERAAPRIAPIPLFGYVARVDLIFRKRGQSIHFGALFGVRLSEVAFFIGSPFMFGLACRSHVIPANAGIQEATSLAESQPFGPDLRRRIVAPGYLLARV
jgi:hypothetical protein